MIIEGGRAGNVGFWASHLLRADTNEKAEIRELRGVLADDLKGALREMQAVAGASRCGPDFMYQANINPRADERLSPEQWQKAVDTLEKNLGFEGHARVVVEHEKEGRQHYHVIWSRVDENLKTVSPYYDYLTCRQTADQLEQAFGLAPVPERRLGPQPIQLWEQQKGEQTKIDPKAMKAELSALWREADSGQAFAAALEERGYILAQGDRRDFCVIDHAGTAHSLARRLDGVKAAEVRERMADIERESLPTVTQASAAQRDRFSDPAQAWAMREGAAREAAPAHDLSGLARDQLPAPEATSAPTSGQPFGNDPATGLSPAAPPEGADDLARKRAASGGMEWQADSGGMVAQQTAALEEVERRGRPDKETPDKEIKEATKEGKAKEIADWLAQRAAAGRTRNTGDRERD